MPTEKEKRVCLIYPYQFYDVLCLPFSFFFPLSVTLPAACLLRVCPSQLRFGGRLPFRGVEGKGTRDGPQQFTTATQEKQDQTRKSQTTRWSPVS